MDLEHNVPVCTDHITNFFFFIGCFSFYSYLCPVNQKLKTMIKKLSMIVIVLLLPIAVLAQSAEECYKKGVEFNDKKEYVQAAEWYLKAANQGHAKAQNNLGALYAQGHGVEKNQAKAIEWYTKSASQGYVYAQNNLAFIYQTGNGVTKDMDKAMEWYTKAANQGFADAQYRLGTIFSDMKDYESAAKWYQKAADQDHASAQINLGALYSDGKGVPQDYKKAAEWYKKSAFQGNAYAQNNLGWLYEKGYGVEQSFVKAAEWYQRAANKGHKMAPNNLKRIQEFLPKESQTLAQNNTTQTSANSTKNTASSTQVARKPQTLNVVDTDIPVIGRVNDNTIAIIIANEDYAEASKVDYALNDGEVFRNYCIKTLGLPEKNVRFLPNATLAKFIGELNWLEKVCTAFKGEASVIFYYAGHGFPDEETATSYLLPTDGNSSLLRTCFSLNELYKTLGLLPVKKVTVVMDACFSGTKRNGEMLTSARGVAIKAKQGQLQGNMVVLSAAQGDETAYKYEEAHHGLFTYFLLKKLKETKGNVTIGELGTYVQDQVTRFSLLENHKSQTPSIQFSDALRSNWKGLKFD